MVASDAITIVSYGGEYSVPASSAIASPASGLRQPGRPTAGDPRTRINDIPMSAAPTRTGEKTPSSASRKPTQDQRQRPRRISGKGDSHTGASGLPVLARHQRAAAHPGSQQTSSTAGGTSARGTRPPYPTRRAGVSLREGAGDRGRPAPRRAAVRSHRGRGGWPAPGDRLAPTARGGRRR